MSDLFEKISKAADAFADIITESENATKTVKIYTYQDFKRYFVKMKKEYPEILKCVISIEQGRQFDDVVYSENKYIIKLVMLKEDNNPVLFGNNPDSYVGTVIIASAIDKDMLDFMGDKTEKTVVMGKKVN